MAVRCRTLTLGSVNGLTFTNGTSNSQTNLVFTANLTAANIAFRTVVYRPLYLQNGEDDIHIEVNDLGASGVYGFAEKCSNDVSVWIVAVNSPPTVTTPPAQTVQFQVPYVITGVSVNDPDVTNVRLQTPLGVADARLTVTVAVSGGGRITLATLAGLRFIAGSGHYDATVTIDGALVDVNNALASLTFICGAEFGCDPSAPETVTVTVNDMGRLGAGGAMQASGTFAVTVAPNPYP